VAVNITCPYCVYLRNYHIVYTSVVLMNCSHLFYANIVQNLLSMYCVNIGVRDFVLSRFCQLYVYSLIGIVALRVREIAKSKH